MMTIKQSEHTQVEADHTQSRDDKKIVEWPTEEEERRQEVVEQNGNTGEHYEKLHEQSEQQVEVTKKYLEGKDG